MLRTTRVIVLIAVSVLLVQGCRTTPKTTDTADSYWPEIQQVQRPWTRWWWMGNAVNETDLTRQLELFREAGFGGVEICPVYGVTGAESQEIAFLSPTWMTMLAHTTQQAQRLGLGVDMTTGTGWPFGGPSVDESHASSGVVLKSAAIGPGGTLKTLLPKEPLQYAVAVSPLGQRLDLTEKLKQGDFSWTPPKGQWRVYLVAMKRGVQKVKRPAPGGEGYVLDPYSIAAMSGYLNHFEEAFTQFSGPMPRAQFHDSFEYYGADWTQDFFEAFRARRGYDLKSQIEALFDGGSDAVAVRVQCDYRRTISDLHHAYMERWTQWSHLHGELSRNQAHGAPGNLIDFYGACDIPETELYGKVDYRQIPMLKFASSAAHINGTVLSSSESFTWLGEHFNTSFAEIKSAANFLFLSGVNHLFFHGIPYSPASAEWPGWQFYASVNMGPQGGLWRDMPAFTSYVARCQSVLQAGRPDQDVLLYYPIYATWQAKDQKNLITFTVHGQEEFLWPTPFYKAAMTLWNRGYGFDEVSDAYLQKATVDQSSVVLGGNRYRVIVVPECRVMPTETLNALIRLASGGAKVIFAESLPSEVPGFYNWQVRQKQFQSLLQKIPMKAVGDHREAVLRQGQWLCGALEPMLTAAGVERETLTEMGFRFVRRTDGEGTYYFLVSSGDKPISDWVPLNRQAGSVVIMDPDTGLAGRAVIRQTERKNTEVYLQMQPGQAVILRSLTNPTVKGRVWEYFSSAGEPIQIEATWRVQFIDGGPELPPQTNMTSLVSWTTLGLEAESFAGTARYTATITVPDRHDDSWLLDLGKVRDSARVMVNGQPAGTLLGPSYQVQIGPYLHPGKNLLSVEVTNLAANRIRQMDRRQIQWKYFKDINVVDVNYKPLDAAVWPVRESGLLGPVRLIRQEKVQPGKLE